MFSRGPSLCGLGPQFPFRDLNDLIPKAFTDLGWRSSLVSHHMTDDGHTLEAFRKREIAGPNDNLLDLGLRVCMTLVPGAVGVLGLWEAEVRDPGPPDHEILNPF